MGRASPRDGGEAHRRSTPNSPTSTRSRHRVVPAASRSCARSLAITAYATGDFALALRELRTYRRISGRDDQIALMVDSERGVGRPDRALEVGRAVDRKASLPTGARVELAIAMSGARLDLEQPDRALLELEIPELDPDRAFEWSPALFAARATVLEELGRDDEAEEWHRRAEVAADALDAASGAGDLETVIVEEVEELHRRRRRTSPQTSTSTTTSDESTRGTDERVRATRAAGRTRRTTDGPVHPAQRLAPLDGVDVILADLDGVVYAGAGALPYAVESLNRARDGRTLAYITNNASRTDASVAAHLTDLGLATAPDEVVTSPQAAMRLLVERIAPGATILVVGGDGLVHEVEKAGFVVTRSADDSPAAVVQGFAPEVGWTQLAEAAFALKVPEEEGGIPWIATNTDWTIPQARGIAPGQRHARLGGAHGGRPPRDRRRQARGADLRRSRRAVRGAASALPRRSPRHRHPRRESRRHPVGARAHRDRSPQARARGARRDRSRPSSSAICANCTSRTRRCA